MEIKCHYPTIILNKHILQLISIGYTSYQLCGQTKSFDEENLKRAIDCRSLHVTDFNIVKGLKIKPNLDAKYYDITKPLYIPPSLIWSYSKILGKRVYTSYYEDNIRPIRNLYCWDYTITYEDASNSLLINQYTGETMPLFQLVNCGHCSLCDERRRNSLSSRLLIESNSYSKPPFFVTLTYSDTYYPTDLSKEYQVNEIQLFIKRLRKRLQGMDIHFKYAMVSEFGSKTHRLHYHLIIFGITDERMFSLEKNIFLDIPNRKNLYVYSLTRYIYNAWLKNGLVDVQTAKDLSGKYISKYLGKQLSENETIHTKSQKLGKSLFDDCLDIEECRKDVHSDKLSLIAPNGSHLEVPYYAWINRQLWPTLSRQLDITFRQAMLHLYKIDSCYQIPVTPELTNYRQYYPLLYGTDYTERQIVQPLSDLDYISEDVLETVYEKLKEYDYNFERVRYIEDCRLQRCYVSDILRPDFDVNVLSTIADKNISLMRQKEID